MNSNTVIKIGIVSDLHYARCDEYNRFKTLSKIKLTEAIAAFKESNVDCIINLGDTIDTAENINEEIELCKEIMEIFDSAVIPVYHVIGNHDVAMFTKDEYLTLMQMQNGFYSVNINGISIYILDGNYHEDGSDFSKNNFMWDNAWISQQQIDWLDSELQSQNVPAIICCHERLDGNKYKSTGNPHVVKNHMKLNEILRKSNNIIAVFSGHDHAGYIANIDNTLYFTCPAMVVAETTAYGIIEIFADNSINIEGAGRFPGLSWQV